MGARKMIVEVVADAEGYARGLAKASGSTKKFDKDVSQASRGLLAGSGVARSFGRSLAFASGGFLAFSSGAALIHKSLEGADNAEKAERALAVTLGKLGENAQAELPSIKAWAEEQARFGVSASDALQGLARLVTLTGSSRKGMEAYTAALAIARTTGKSFDAVSLAVAKAMNNQTGALSRYIGTVKKGTGPQALIGEIMAKFGGQAAANTTAIEVFNAELANSEQIIGEGILPTLNEYLAKGSKWLQQMNESGKLQKDVSTAAHDFAGVLSAAADVIKSIDKVTGSFKHTLELLLGLKLLKFALGAAGGFGRMKTAMGLAVGEAGTLRLALLGIGSPEVLAALGAAYVAFRLFSNNPATKGGRPATISNIVSGIKPGIGAQTVAHDIATLRIVGISKSDPVYKLVQRTFELLQHSPGGQLSQAQFNTLKSDIDAILNPLVLSGSHSDTRLRRGSVGTDGPLLNGPGSKSTPGLTVAQRNTFFDNSIARLLLRGGLGNIDQQIAALRAADAKLAARVAVTKDVTRKLKLEDEILQNQAQIGGLVAQKRDAFLNTLADATGSASFAVQVAQTTASFDDDIVALKGLEKAIETQIAAEGRTNDLVSQLFDARQQLAAARASKLAGRQLVALGLTPTGDQKVPGTRALKKLLGSVSDQVAGTFLDTAKVRSLFGRIRRVLSGELGSVGTDVRQKIQQILSNLNDQLDHNTARNLTKWHQLSSAAFLAGVPNLTPAQKRELSARFSTLGPGGTVPPGSSGAFSGAGATSQTTVVNIDGQTVAKVVTKHQRRQAQTSRTSGRRGLGAGRF